MRSERSEHAKCDPGELRETNPDLIAKSPMIIGRFHVRLADSPKR